MHREAFDRAREEANKAAATIARIRNASSLQEIADHWSAFLSHVQRSYTRLRIACKEGTSKGWCDQVFLTRNTDELLKYVLHARNADEHGVARITAQKNAWIGIRPKKGNVMNVDHLSIRDGKITMGPEVSANASITFSPGEVLLIPVRDRGIIYNVPTEHLGQKLTSATLLDVAERAEAFLRSKLNEADFRF